MQAFVSFLFIRTLSPSEKADYGDDRVGDITGKPEFSDILSHGIILGNLTQAGVDLRTAIRDADGGTDLQEFKLKAAIAKWNRLIKKVGKYVTEKAQEKDAIDDQVAVISVSGFDYNKIKKAAGSIPARVSGFRAHPSTDYPGIVKIKSDSLGVNMMYISVFHKNRELLEAISFTNNQLNLPADVGGFILHHTTDSRETEVVLTSAEKWHGTRFAINKTGRGANSQIVSVIPQ